MPLTTRRFGASSRRPYDPAYRRAAAARSEGYHIALATAMALAPLAVEPADAQAFVTRFLAVWGQARRNGPG